MIFQYSQKNHAFIYILFFIYRFLFYLCAFQKRELKKRLNMDNTKIVGEKIKSLRDTKQISIAELAERTGLAEEQIERIENNVDIPSLAPLIKIARALGVRLGTFLDDQEEVGAVITRKQDDAQGTISFSNNAMNARTHMHYQSLSKSKADRHMEPFIIGIEATDDERFHVAVCL